MNQVQLNTIQKYAHAQLQADKTGHGFDHIQRVVAIARQIATQEQANLFITLAAAYLHDVIDDKLVADPQAAQAHVRTFLSTTGLTPTEVEQIMVIITNMSFASTLNKDTPSLSLEGQIVQDADWLDAIGAIGIIRAVYFGGAHGEKIHDPAIPPRHNMSKEEYRNLDHETIINHFDEKLFKISAMLNTPTGRKMAAHRHRFMQEFLAEFHAEWAGQK